jgi:hypothetical protein
MTKFLVGKWTSLAALLSASVLLSGCQTSVGKPTLCSVNGKPAACKVVKRAKTPAKRPSVKKKTVDAGWVNPGRNANY